MSSCVHMMCQKYVTRMEEIQCEQICIMLMSQI